MIARAHAAVGGGLARIETLVVGHGQARLETDGPRGLGIVARLVHGGPAQPQAEVFETAAVGAAEDLTGRRCEGGTAVLGIESPTCALGARQDAVAKQGFKTGHGRAIAAAVEVEAALIAEHERAGEDEAEIVDQAHLTAQLHRVANLVMDKIVDHRGARCLHQLAFDGGPTAVVLPVQRDVDIEVLQATRR